MRTMRTLTTTLIAGAAATAAASAAADYRPLTLGSASVIATGETELFGAASYGAGQEARERGPIGESGDYDTFRLGPVGFRHGVFDAVEYGAYLSFVNNSEDDDGAPDESGLEGLTGFAKLALNDHLALEVGTRMGGADDVAPYPNDGIDFYVNFPMQRAVGDGLIYGELGYTIQDQDVGGTYTNWGLGYAHPLDNGTNLNIELAGDKNPVGDNHMDLLIGAGLQVEQVHLRPYVGLGLYDASPDISVGVGASLPL